MSTTTTGPDSRSPSPTALALLDGVADAKGRKHALRLVDTVGKTTREITDAIIAEHGADSLYVMQVVGEVLVWTVHDTLQKLLANRKH